MAANVNQGSTLAGSAVALATLDTLIAKGILNTGEANAIFQSAGATLRTLPIDQAGPALQVLAQLGLRYQSA